MLDLDPRVHLQEEVVAVAVQQPLDGARAPVTDCPGSVDAELPDPVTEVSVDRRRGCLLDELLVTPPNCAVALAQVNDGAVRVREDLDFDVPRILEVALDVDGVVGEVRLALAPRRRKRPLRVVGPAHHLEALAPASR